MVSAPPTSAERASAVVAAVVLALSLLGVAAVVVLIDDDVTTSASPAPAGVPGGAGPRPDGPRPDGPGTADPGGSSATRVPLTWRTFPLPPGVRRERDAYVSPGQRYFSLTGARLPAVERFLDRELRALGYEWRRNPILDEDGGTAGYLGSIDLGRSDYRSASLNIDYGGPGFYDPTTVWIGVTLP